MKDPGASRPHHNNGANPEELRVLVGRRNSRTMEGVL